MNCCHKPDCPDVYCPGRPTSSAAKIRSRMPGPEPLPPFDQGRYLRPLAAWMLIVLMTSVCATAIVILWA
jgi:hypothetical protein